MAVVTYDPVNETEADIDAWIAAAGQPYDDPYAYSAHSNRIVSADELSLWQAVTLRNAKRALAALMHNYLFNGGFGIWQRGGISGAVTMNDDVYESADRWNSLRQGSGVTIQRQAAGSGFEAPYVARFVSGGTTNRAGINQILEYKDTFPLRGKAMKLALKAKANKNAGSGSIDLRYAVLEWIGTADAPTSDIVNDWTSSTYTTGNFFTSTTINLLATGSTSFVHGTAAQATLDLTVGASANNIIVIIWLEDVPAHASDYIELSEVGLYRGTYAPPEWKPRPFGEELRLCQRYCCKTFNLETTPAQNLGTYLGVVAATASGTVLNTNWVFPVTMRTTPGAAAPSVITTYNPGAANANWRDGAGSDDATPGTSVKSDGMVAISGTGAIDATNYYIHVMAEAEL